MGKFQIDINCDLGESYDDHVVGNDEAIFPYITSCNIACGFHGGDPHTIERTIALAIQHGVSIGAHPSYPDREGFGRTPMSIPPGKLKSILKYQVAALKGLMDSRGARLKYVKPHGALYNLAARDEQTSAVICDAIREIDASLALLGLAGSKMEALARAAGLSFVREAFVDRRYLADGTLAPRNGSGSSGVINHSEAVVKQALQLVKHKSVQTIDGGEIEIHADSICIHGDHPGSPGIAKALRYALDKEGIDVKPFSR